MVDEGKKKGLKQRGEIFHTDNYVNRLSEKISFHNDEGDGSGYEDDIFSMVPNASEMEKEDNEDELELYGQPTQIKPGLIDEDQFFILEIIRGNEQGRRYPLVNEVTKVGRGLDNDIVLTDIAVSRKHLKIYRQGDQITIQDLGSGNGTIVNGRRIQTTILQPGSVVEIGNTVFKILWPGERSKASQPQFQPTPQPPPPTINPQDPLYRKPTQVGGRAYTFPFPSTQQQRGMPPQQEVYSPQAGIGYPRIDPQSTSSSPQLTTEIVRGGATNTSSIKDGGSISQLRSAFISMPKSARILIILIVSVTVVILIAGIITKIVLSLKSPKEPPQQINIEILFREGVLAFTQGRWHDAVNNFQRILTIVPQEPNASRYLEKALLELEIHNKINLAKDAIQKGEPEKALTILKDIPESSVQYPQVLELRKESQSLYIKQLLEQATVLRNNNSIDEAKKKIEIVLSLDPGNPIARNLMEEINNTTKGEEGRGKVYTTPSKIEPSIKKQLVDKDKVSKGKDITKEIIKSYMAENFQEAIAKARTLADRSQGKEKEMLQALATDITNFVEAYKKYKTAVSDGARLKSLKDMIKFDKRIVPGGYYANKYQKEYIERGYSYASKAWHYKQYEEACQTIMEILGISPNHEKAQKALAYCEKKAQEFYENGKKYAKTNVTLAKTNLRNVMKMVPPSSQLYKDAYKLLNSLSSSTKVIDEDE